MPAFDPSTPRQARKVHGVAVTVPILFRDGDTLSADTARWASNAAGSQFINSIGSAMAQWAKDTNANKAKGAPNVEAKDYPDLQAKLDALITARVLGVNARKGTGAA